MMTISRVCIFSVTVILSALSWFLVEPHLEQARRPSDWRMSAPHFGQNIHAANEVPLYRGAGQYSDGGGQKEEAPRQKGSMQKGTQ
jgi:hypothetical protein